MKVMLSMTFIDSLLNENKWSMSLLHDKGVVLLH